MIAVTVVTAVIRNDRASDGTTAVNRSHYHSVYVSGMQKMKIDPRIPSLPDGAMDGVMNLLPWGGLTARAATVLEMDATELWRIRWIPLQVVGLVMKHCAPVVLGMVAIKHGARLGKGEEVAADEKERKKRRLKKSPMLS